MRSKSGLVASKSRPDKLKPKISRDLLEQMYWQEEYSFEDIARSLGVSSSSVHYWFKKLGIPTRDQQVYTNRRRKKLSTIISKISLQRWQNDEYRKKRVKELRSRSTPNLMPSPSLAYILGALLGDGYINNGRRITLQVKDILFAKSFAAALRNIGLNSGVCRAGRNMFLAYAWSASFGDWYSKLTLTDISNFLTSKELKLAFLKGFYEAEGSVEFRNGWGRLSMFNKNHSLLQLVKNILVSLGYNPTLTWRKTRDIGQVNLNRKGEIRRFLEETKPSIKNPFSVTEIVASR